MEIKTYFQESSSTFTYLLFDKLSREALLIDPAANFNKEKDLVSFEEATLIQEDIQNQNLCLKYIVETHPHADHLTSAMFFKEQNPKSLYGISHFIPEVQKTFSNLYSLDSLKTDGSQFDLLLNEKSELTIGNFKLRILETPGHTPTCLCFLINNYCFTGDSLFMPDFGTGRCDFPSGSAENLFDSIKKKILTLPRETVILVGHDYGPNQRKIENRTSVEKQIHHNIHLQGTREDFISFRKEKDKGLPPPALLIPSIKFNINGGVKLFA